MIVRVSRSNIGKRGYELLGYFGLFFINPIQQRLGLIWGYNIREGGSIRRDELKFPRMVQAGDIFNRATQDG